MNWKNSEKMKIIIKHKETNKVENLDKKHGFLEKEGN